MVHRFSKLTRQRSRTPQTNHRARPLRLEQFEPREMLSGWTGTDAEPIFAHLGHSDVPGTSSLQRNATPERLLKLNASAGVRYSVVVPVRMQDYRDANAWVAAVSALFPDRFHPFARIDPAHRGSATILAEAFDTLGLRGLKLALRRDDFPPHASVTR